MNEKYTTNVNTYKFRNPTNTTEESLSKFVQILVHCISGKYCDKNSALFSLDIKQQSRNKKRHESVIKK